MKLSRQRNVKLSMPFVVLAIIAVIAGCGDDGDSTSTSTSEKTAGRSQEPLGPPAKSSEQLAREFPDLASDLELDGWSLSSQAEKEAASAVAEEFADAKVSKDLDIVCANLSANMLKEVEELVATVPDPPDNCSDSLALALENYSLVWDENYVEGLDFLLVKGTEGYALYHGSSGSLEHGGRGSDWIMRMKWEDGEWKIDDFGSMSA